MNNRRTFLKEVAWSGMGALVLPNIKFSHKFEGPLNGKRYQGGVVPISVVEDSATLAFSAGVVPGHLANSLLADINLEIPGNKGRLISVIPQHDKKIIQLLDHLRTNKEDENYLTKVAIAFGYAANGAYYDVFQPVLQKLSDVQEAIYYQDVHLMRNRAKKVNEDSNISALQFENILKVLLPRAIARIHTFKPDLDDGRKWVQRMSAWRRNKTDQFEQYGKIYASPDPKLQATYLDEIKFFDSNEPLIKTCIRLQAGLEVTPDKINSILDSATESLYGQAVKKAVKNIFATSEYIQGKIGPAELEKQLGLI